MTILLLEDETDIAEPVVEALIDDRYGVVWVRDVAAAHDAVAERPFDLLLVDVTLPRDEDAGFRFASEARAAGFQGAVMFLSARDAVADRIRGLDLGGDDYLVKPFSLDELLARVRALVRRRAPTKQSILDRPPLRVDLATRSVAWGGRTVALTDREFAILELFALHPDRIFTVDELLERFFPDAASGHRVVRVYVSQLRQKVDADVIETVAGGYRLGGP
ncbi:MAG: response regulator transcription factor [bacterium]|nr:response regulator transcription factor [bacterium]